MLIFSVLFCYQLFVEFLFLSWLVENNRCCNLKSTKQNSSSLEQRIRRSDGLKRDGVLLLSPGPELSCVLPLLHPERPSLPEPKLLPGQLSHAALGVHGGKVRCLSMAFESVSCSCLHVLCWSRAFAVLC